MMTDSVIGEYTQHIDTSEMIIEYYKNQTTAGLEKHFLTLEGWLNRDVEPEENRPLVIQAGEGVGKKTLLAQWMKYHQEKSQKIYPDVIIPHFAGTGGNNANYYYALYKILVRLRENFNISQKVELVEEKLTRYFNYWLEISSKALASRVVDDSNVILVFDSINMFIDPDTNEESNVSLWLPSTFPKGIKVIVSTDAGSSSFKQFEDLGCDIINIEAEKVVPDTVIKTHLSRPCYITDETYRKKVVDTLQTKNNIVTKNYLFLKTYLSALLPYPSDRIIKESDINRADFFKIFKGLDFTKLPGINDVEALNSFLLEYFSRAIIDGEKFKKIMCALTLTVKGLTESELLSLVKIEVREWRYITAIFKTFFMTHKGLWKITNESFKKTIYNLYLQKNTNYTRQLHEEISEVLNKTSNSLRKLEEETYHLNGCRAYFKLKEAISNIENFILLFTPNNKFELCRYWQILEHKGFDPASEYTKAIEGFELHYRPNPEDTFLIILQVSRFLKEFGDFETEITPEFRHPPIKGGKEMKEIGLRREIKKLGIYLPENWDDDDDKNDDLEEIEHELVKEFPDYSDEMIKDLTNQIYASTQKKKQEDAEREAAKNAPPSDETESQEEAKPAVKVVKKVLKKEPPILSSIEMLNVDIPENRERFRAFYLEDKNKKKKKEEEEVLAAQQAKEVYLDQDDNQVDQEQKEVNKEARTEASTFRTKSTLRTTTLETAQPETRIVPYDEEYAELSKGEVSPTFYYYKRWLWMMFPWVCLSYKMNYSKIIFDCFSSAIKYLPVPEEKEKTRQALKIALEAKMKKQLILARPTDGDSSITRSIKVGSTTPLRGGKKTLPPIMDRKASMGRVSTMSLNKEGLETQKSFVSGTSSPVREDTDRVIALRNHKKLKEHQFFITNEFLDSSNFSASLSLNKSPDARSSPDFSVSNLSIINRESNRSPIREKALFASEKRFEQTLQKSNESLKTLLLPRYQDSVISYSDKQVEELDARVQKLNLQLNEIVYQNKTTAKKLKDLSVIEVNLNGTGATDIADKAKLRVVELEEQLQKADYNKQEAMKQKHRLESLIHICFKNKKEDELYIRSLNYLLTNFKKMIAWERDLTYDNLMKATDLEKLSQQYMKACDDKIQAYEMMITHVREEKQNTTGIDRKINQVYSNLGKSANEAVDDLKMTAVRNEEKEQKRMMRKSIFKDKQLAERENLDEKRQFLKVLQEKIGLDYNSPNFQGFMDYIEKLSEFESGVFHTNNEVEKLKEEKRVQANHLETLKKARSNMKAQTETPRSPYDNIATKEELRDILKTKKKKADDLSNAIIATTKLVLDTNALLTRVFGGIGVELEKEQTSSKTMPIEKLQAALDGKFKLIKEKIGDEAFNKFKKGRLEVNVYTTLSVENYQSTKSELGAEQEGRDYVGVFKHGRKFVEVNFNNKK